MSVLHREGTCPEHGYQDLLTEGIGGFDPVGCPVDGCTRHLAERFGPPDPFRPYYVKSQGVWINSKDEERTFEKRAEANGGAVISRSDSAKRAWRDSLREGMERDARKAGFRDHAALAEHLNRSRK